MVNRASFIKVYCARDGWRWRMVFDNDILAVSGEGFSKKKNTLRSLSAIKRILTEGKYILMWESRIRAKRPSVEIFKGRGDAPYRWRLRAANSKTVASPGQGFDEFYDCYSEADLFLHGFLDAVKDIREDSTPPARYP